MANPVTLLQLRTAVLAETDSENDGHITTAFVNAQINRGIRRYRAKATAADPDRFLVSAALATTAGTLEYALPATFYAIRGLDLEEGGTLHTLRSYNFEERARRRALGGSGSNHDLPRYRVARSGDDGSDEVVIFDIDPGTRSYTLHYLPVPVDLAADASAIDDVLGFADFVVAFASSKVRNRRDEPNQSELVDMAQAEAAIASEGKRRHVDGFEKPPQTRRRRHSNNPLRW